MAWVISTSGWRTVVSGGLVEAAAATSSKPMTATSSGTRRPACRARRLALRQRHRQPLVALAQYEVLKRSGAVEAMAGRRLHVG